MEQQGNRRACSRFRSANMNRPQLATVLATRRNVDGWTIDRFTVEYLWVDRLDRWPPGELRTAGELGSVELVILAHVSCIVNDEWYD